MTRLSLTRNQTVRSGPVFPPWTEPTVCPTRRAVHRVASYCKVKFTVTVMMTGTGTPFSSVGVYSHCRTASSAAWSSNGIDRRTSRVLHLSVRADRRLDDHDALHARRLSNRGVDRVHVTNLLRGLDVATNADRLGRRRWGWRRWRFGNATCNAADDATRDATFDTSGDPFADTGVRRLRLDFCRSLCRSRVGVADRRLHLGCGRRGWRRGGRRRGRRRRRHEGRHRGLRGGQHVGRHQRNDDNCAKNDDVEHNRQGNRVPRSRSHLDRRIHHVAEHLTWHGPALPASQCGLLRFQLKSRDYSQRSNARQRTDWNLRHRFRVVGSGCSKKRWDHPGPPLPRRARPRSASGRTTARRTSRPPGNRPPTARASPPNPSGPSGTRRVPPPAARTAS